jgi:hypothetical protein
MIDSAAHPHRRPTGHARTLAPPRVSSVLALEISPRGRPRIPVNLQQLIAEMATANRTWVRSGLRRNCY